MKKDHLIRRYGQFIAGLFVASLGVALSTKAGLGTSPVASVPYSVSLLSGLFSFGGWLNLWSVIQIGVQILLLRKACDFIEIGIQTLLAFLYGYLTNFSVSLLDGLNPNTYPAQFGCMLLGCLVLGLGIWIQFKGQVAMLPGEAMNRAIAKVTGKRYETVKIFFDVLYIAVSALIGILFLGGLKGVREGSVIAAVLVGTLIRAYNKIWDRCFHKNHV